MAVGAGGGPAWGGIAVTLPWQVWRHYGDLQILQQSYPSMEAYVRWLDSRSKDNVLQAWGGYMDFLADWAAPGRDQHTGVPSPEPCRGF